jgi:hypothetical protein
MEKIIKYKRFNESHTEKTIQDFLDKLVTDGWEIIYYNEIRQSSGVLTNSPQEVNIHVTVVACKKNYDNFPF